MQSKDPPSQLHLAALLLLITLRGGEIIVFNGVFNDVFNKGLTRTMLGVTDIYPGVLTASRNLSLGGNSKQSFMDQAPPANTNTLMDWF